MHCASCQHELTAFTGDVCPHCTRIAHPTKLGVYENLELIKRGGMGTVYKARHPELGTLVAIKVVTVQADADALVKRFEREARLAARIPHPGVVLLSPEGEILAKWAEKGYRSRADWSEVLEEVSAVVN